MSRLRRSTSISRPCRKLRLALTLGAERLGPPSHARAAACAPGGDGASAGDEGKLFRRLLGGERLSARAIANLRAENDQGHITVNGELLVHEVAHVWQYQNGGTDYMSEALYSQAYGKGYNWAMSVPDTLWKELEPEQQAEFLESAYRYGAFDPDSPRYGRFSSRVEGSNRPIDLTPYLQTALQEVHAGRGAP